MAFSTPGSYAFFAPFFCISILPKTVNRVYSLYPEQINRNIFNFLDTHDTMRATSRCGDIDVFYQQLAVLMTMPGSACIFYGTEIAMPGGHDPDCRRPMPWDEINNGRYVNITNEVKKMISLRRDLLNCHNTDIVWHHDPDYPRLICYDRLSTDGLLRVYLNAGVKPIFLSNDSPIYYQYHYNDGVLDTGGICIICSQGG